MIHMRRKLRNVVSLTTAALVAVSAIGYQSFTGNEKTAKADNTKDKETIENTIEDNVTLSTTGEDKEEPAVLVGDFDGNGKVGSADRVYLARHLAKWEGYEDIDEKAADVNADGKIDITDATETQKYVAGLTEFTPEQEAAADHGEGVELRKPGNHDGREAATARDGGRDGVVGAAHQKKPRKAAYRTRHDERAHDDPIDLDAYVASRVGALAHHRDLVAVLAVVEVHVHADRDESDQNDVEQVLEVTDLR